MFGELKSWFQQLVADKKVETDETAFVGEQAKFLLTQAALVTAPDPNDRDSVARLRRVSSKFGYMHPTTFTQIVGGCAKEHGDSFYTISGAPDATKWILTTLMPEGTVIMSPNILPGIESLVAAQVAKEAVSRA